jgi:hypothetical protein
MDVREYIDRNAPGFFAALPFDEQTWLAEAGHTGPGGKTIAR